MPEISVIIPVYNCRDYLEPCLRSVAAQSHRDWECVLVDDGSTDGSAGICDAWAAADSRIRVVHTPNAGVSAARNTGLDTARGRWIAFVDSDDILEPGYLRELIEASGGVDLVCCGWEHQGSRQVPPGGEVERDSYSRVFFESGFNYEYVWGKLLSSDLIRRAGLRFAPGVRWAEDVLFINEYFIHSRRARLVPQALYRYTYRPGSGVRRIHPAESEYLGYEAAMRLMPKMTGAFTPQVKRWFGPYGYLHRYVMAVLQQHPDRATRLQMLRRTRFDRRLAVRPAGNMRERLVHYLILHRHWRLLTLIWRK